MVDVTAGSIDVRLAEPAIGGNEFVRAPAQGPVLAHRALADGVPVARLHDWSLTLDDVELF